MKKAGWIFRAVNHEITCHLIDLESGERLGGYTCPKINDVVVASEVHGHLQEEIEQHFTEYEVDSEYVEKFGE